MYSSESFGRIFWVDDDLEFKSCPLNVDETGDFDNTDYVSEWDDFSDVDMNLLLAIHRCELLNKVQYKGSILHKEAPVVDTFTEDNYNDKVDTLVDKMGMTNYKFDEQFYNEIVINDKYRFPRFNETDYPIHLSQS